MSEIRMKFKGINKVKEVKDRFIANTFCNNAATLPDSIEITLKQMDSM